MDMDARHAALRRKPLPGPPPMPPPPAFDPFPQQHHVLRGARSTPNLRQSDVPSFYDPPPAYEEFPGVGADGRIAAASAGPGRLPSPAPASPASLFPGPPQAAETFPAAGQYRAYRPAGPPSPGPVLPEPTQAVKKEFRAYQPPSPGPAGNNPFFPGPAQPAEKDSKAYYPLSPGPPNPSSFFPGPPPAQEKDSKAYHPPSPGPPSSGSFLPGPPQSSEKDSITTHYGPPPGPPSPSSFFPGPPQASEKDSITTHHAPLPGPPSPGPFFPGPPQSAGTFPIAAHHRPPPPPAFPPPPAAQTFPIAALQSTPSPGYAPSEAPSTDSQTKEKTFWQTALDEATYFAGGLVSHPFEYTKHYAILRHSLPLVWYRGPSTSVTVTVFADAPLPPSRTVWLQRKGYSGNMGMNLKSLVGANTSWLDVTPSARASPADMPDGDERGCQRDIKKFLKKAPKNLARHAPRETHVVRIPAAADDGYFRLVLCTGGDGPDGGKRKVLCPSPVFRVASTSADASVVRGASLASMPLEIGVKVGTTIASTVANRYIGPAAAVVQARTKKIQTARFVTKHAAHIATARNGVEKSGIKAHVTAIEEQYAAARGGGYTAWQDGGAEGGFQEAPPEVVGPDSGPAAPFPIKFDGRVVRGTGRGGTELGIPTANLADVPEDVRMRMRGVYFGWARISQTRSGLEGVSQEWHESIVTVGPAPYATPRVAAENVATVHMIHEFGGALFHETRLKVLVMGQLRAAAPPVGSEAAREAYGADVLLAVASLSRENWGPAETREMLRTRRSEMSLAEHYLETRERVQKQVDRLPVHRAGVRTEGARLRDQAYGKGGIWIPR